jgi:signal transduction histidine kinase
MSLRTLKLFTILLPCFIIGGFEYVRHDFMTHYLSMETGNFYITLLTLCLSYIFASWMFRKIERINNRLSQEQARRAVYEERERLATELHDNLAQTLFFLNVKLKLGELEDAKAAVSEIDSSLRQAIFNLRTPPEAGTAFSDRLHKWLKEWETVTGIELSEEISLHGHAFSASEEVQLFGIVQEAFTNIRKHSGATFAAITLHVTSEGWLLHITDNGSGIEKMKGSKSQSYGIDMMQKRATELGATWELKPEANEAGADFGTSLQVKKQRSKI